MPRKPSREAQLKYFMEKSQTDPAGAGQELIQFFKSRKPTKEGNDLIESLELILRGDKRGYNSQARNMTEAIQFIIFNTFLSGAGLGVIQPGRRHRNESVVADVANMISEDVDFQPMSLMQKRMKGIVESYGFSVYVVRNRKHVHRLDALISESYEGLEDNDQFYDPFYDPESNIFLDPSLGVFGRPEFDGPQQKEEDEKEAAIDAMSREQLDALEAAERRQDELDDAYAITAYGPSPWEDEDTDDDEEDYDPLF